MKLLILTDKDVQKALSMSEAVDVCSHAFQQLSTGKATVPLRTIMSTPFGYSGFMPAFCPGDSGEDSALGLKIVAVRPNNPKDFGLATIPAQVLLVDPQRGTPLVLMDATYLTLLRTAAGSGAATKFMAKEAPRKLVVFGAGNQAHAHVEAMLTVKPSIKKVIMVNRTIESASDLVKQLSNDSKYRGVTFSSSNNPRVALAGADLVVTATASPTPLFDGDDLEPGCHLNCVGSHHPTVQEVDSKTIKKALVVVDERKGCLAEAGDIMVPIKEGLITADHVIAELGEVTGGKQIRQSETDITLFKSVGNAVQDVSVGLAVYKKAKALGLGIMVDTTAAKL